MQSPSAAHFAKQPLAVDPLRGRLYDRASLAEERRRWNVSRKAIGGLEAVEASTGPQSLASILDKKIAAQDMGEAFDTSLVMNFPIFEVGLIQT
jgi:hypothetical protein